MKISIKQILDWKPCSPYNTREKIIKRTDVDWPKTLLEIANLDIPIVDKFWVLLRSDVIDKKTLHLLACDFAEHMLPVYETQYPDDNRPRRAIEIKRLWLEGKATDAELIKAKNAAYAADAAADADAEAARAAFCVVYAAAYTATDAAIVAYNAATYVANAAYHSTVVAAAACVTERTWQLERVKEVLKEIEK